MNNKIKLDSLEKSIDNKINNIQNYIYDELCNILDSLKNKEIELSAFRMILDNNTRIFIRRVYVWNNKVLIEYTSNCYDYRIMEFNNLYFTDKIRLCHYLNEYGVFS